MCAAPAATCVTLESVEIGTDDSGAPTTAPVVIPTEPRSQQRSPGGRRLPKAAQTALRALQEAISECGAVPPASNHIPEGVHVVTVEQWRSYAYRMGISASDTTERARQAAFKRATEQLIGSNCVGCWDDMAWTI